MPLHLDTPLIASHPLSRSAGRSIWLKLDGLQPPGSFKIRGIGHACEVHRAAGATRFVSSSGGNAGLAVAYAGHRMGIAVVVVVPQTTTERALALLRQHGAEVVVHGASWQEANEHALSLVGPADAFIHPFDDPLLWDGHATLIDEVAAAGLRPDAVVLCVGGGGLLCGVAEGLQRNGMAAVPILAVETEGAASLHDAMRAGELVTLDRIATVATSLGARRVAARALAWTRERTVHSLLVSDASALRACERFLDDHRMLVEPACGASLALAYDHAEQLAPYGTVLIIACGGATATIDQIRAWSAAGA
ncbi:MAG: pyridoxal-phosphate dependent enzyme [Gemmatimonadaceae bacterium]|nr:pyridoxal-phosphate dependent enzyme [Gemmatimonadaceae bacterium]